MPKLKRTATWIDPATGEEIDVLFDDLQEARMFVEIGTWAHVQVWLRETSE